MTASHLTIAGLAVLMEIVAIGLGSSSAAAEERLSASDAAVVDLLANQHGTTPSPPDAITGSVVPPTAAAPPKSQESPARGNPLWSVSLQSLSTTRERPIFSASRRPRPSARTPSAPPPPAATQPSRPLLSLVGAIAADNDGIALFVDLTNKTMLRLKIGESHLGWTLLNVDRREATLQRGRESIVFAIPSAR